MPHNPGSFSELCVRFWLLLDAGVGMIPVEIAQGMVQMCQDHSSEKELDELDSDGTWV